MFGTLKRRLQGRGDSEHEQAALRIVIVGLVLAYMALFHGAPSRWTALDWTIVLGLTGFFLLAIGIFVSICIWPAANVPRRLIGMVADNGGATWYMCLAGEYGFSMVGVFLFVTFGNGFRYGRRYLFASQVMTLAGFASVIGLVPYWQGHRAAGIGLLIALIVLPLYISTLLRRIQEARAKAEEANLAKTSFLANMSHEMRTPLNGIVGVVDLLRTTAMSGQQTELVGLLRHSISVLRSLVDDVLDITKIEAGRLTIEVAPFDLHACVNGLIQLLRPHAQAKGLALQATVDPALEYRLKGDSHHLRQILLNLLGNAIKFTERGEVTLTVTLKQETEDGVTARFEVNDTGIGIAADAVAKIFERFVQADQSTTRKYGGTGLGTTIAKQLAELMGGTIGVQSTLGKGSTFWVELPLLRDVVADAEAQAEVHSDFANGGVCLVIAAPGYGEPQSALRSIGERYELVVPAAALAGKIDKLKESGTLIRALVAACPVDQACSAFATATQRLGDSRAALIYVANGTLSVVDKARVNSISGACALEHATPRLVANAIHAVTAGIDSNSHNGADLAVVLGRDRAALRILVAEDNTTNQKIIQQLLESAGHEVILASDGEEALDLYETEQPDLAILDFNMPQRTGVEVIKAIRMMEPAGVRMPTMILSASVTPEARDRAANAGADEFVGKPFDAASLVHQIDRLGKRVAHRKESRTRDDVHARRAPRRPRHPEPVTAAGQTVPINPDLLDGSRLSQLEDIARDASFLRELIGGFVNDVETILAKTQNAVTVGELGELPDLMHTLKGAAVGVGAKKLAALATAIERNVSSETVPSARAKLAEVQSCFKATAACLEEYLRYSSHTHP
ncbi:MAG TPA: ATP-binding protein [Casimicrobiaceae bacterium]